jgi:hypothetical protein
VSFAYFFCVILCGFFFFFSPFDVTVKCFHQIVMIALKICLKASFVLFAVRTAPLGRVCFVLK